jgi:hypothetical protein
MRIVPAPSARTWMDETGERFANRCLPLLVANQAGWLILNDQPLSVTWSGGERTGDLTVKPLDGKPRRSAKSHFGHGILTWHLPYLFRTSTGYNLLARGPANSPKDGIYALEGIIETDWACATFTMNWKLTRPNSEVVFEVDEPICMIVPQRRGEIEAFRPEVRDLESEPEVAERFQRWSRSRQDFLWRQRARHPAVEKAHWQKDYFRGQGPGGYQAPEHQVKLRLRPFEE